ncbi:hypothetical protein P171DRAFT_482256 [Karstenula rhodostoma CBS 690.94]|uniref:Uncharacterized protein n=1 Tax=Karstenula rhodostoma CBS 690.94 TaxID=1392251 RepID=A0A9P4UFH6_9PLEO|nr:hypothetical protein P171DRAFT_482256 [Karstenula rhodostoma CBS 690.94]
MSNKPLPKDGFDLSKVPTGPFSSQPKHNEYQRCTSKGAMLMNAMTANIKDAGNFLNPPIASAESKFTSSPAWQDLARWGYEYCDATTVDAFYGDFKMNWGISKALQSNGLSDAVIRSPPPPPTRPRCARCHNAVLYLTHYDLLKKHTPPCEQSYLVGGKKYTYTGATCVVSINPDQGVLIAMDRTSPTHMVKCHDNLITPPDLVHTSDIMFALWKDIAGDHRIRDLHYFLSICIDNDVSERVIQEVTKGQLASYPGRVFSTEDPEGQALLGMPTAVAIGYLLAQHKEAMGVRFVDSVCVFKSDSQSQSPCLMFHISSGDDDGRSVDGEGQDKKRARLV